MKECTNCHRQLPTTCFGVRNASKDGLSPNCKECRAAYQKSRNLGGFQKRQCDWCGRHFIPTSPKVKCCCALCVLWSYVDEGKSGDCWPFLGPKTKAGYPVVSHDKVKFYGHRLICEQTHGEIPAGMYATHSCDNPPCCNPDHIRPGTPFQNFMEAIERGHRQHINFARGDRHPMRRKAMARRAKQLGFI